MKKQPVKINPKKSSEIKKYEVSSNMDESFMRSDSNLVASDSQNTCNVGPNISISGSHNSFSSSEEEDSGQTDNSYVSLTPSEQMRTQMV